MKHNFFSLCLAALLTSNVSTMQSMSLTTKLTQTKKSLDTLKTKLGSLKYSLQTLKEKLQKPSTTDIRELIASSI